MIGYPDPPIKEYEPDIMQLGEQLIKSSECPIYEMPQDSELIIIGMRIILLSLQGISLRRQNLL